MFLFGGYFGWETAGGGNRVRAAPAPPGAGKVLLGAPDYRQHSPGSLRATEILLCPKTCTEAPSDGLLGFGWFFFPDGK